MAFIKSQPSQPKNPEERKAPRDCASLAEELSDPNPVARRWAARLSRCVPWPSAT